ncbi:MAG: glucose-1-phosphate thymidylyltransferase, partial [Clostridiales bacterium]|nr:glucose-1-phosphate thymidylyltransferase [Clostridiales bacterium]
YNSNFKGLLGDGSRFGVNFRYIVQPEPKGLAQAFVLGEDFIGDDSCAMALGDNIFYGNALTDKLNVAVANAGEGYATVFGYYVNDPERFGIMEVDDDGNVLSIEEKPEKPRSNYCVTGLYFYPRGVPAKAKQVSPSDRGEYEITSLNAMYLKEKTLRAEMLGRGYAWLDTGTVDSLAYASEFVRMIQNNQGVVISSPEEVAYNRGWISEGELSEAVSRYGKSPYGVHLEHVLEGKLFY